MRRATSTYDVLAYAPSLLPAKVLAYDFLHTEPHTGWHPQPSEVAFALLHFKPEDAGFPEGQTFLEWLGPQPLFATLFVLSFLWTLLFLYCVKRPGEE